MLIAQDVAYGPKPLDVANYRDPWALLGGLLVVGGLALEAGQPASFGRTPS